MLIGCDYQPQLATDLLAGHDDGRDGRQEAGACVGEAERFLSAVARAGSDRDGVDGQLPVVCGDGPPQRDTTCWIGDAAKIRASDVRAQKHDRRDAALILKLLREGRFPRIWTPVR